MVSVTTNKVITSALIVALMVTSSLVVLNISSVQPIMPSWMVYVDPVDSTLYRAKAPNGTICFTSTNASSVFLNVLASSKRTVLVLAGSYYLDTEVAIPQETCLTGLNEWATKLYWTGVVGGKMFSTTGADVIFSKLYLKAEGIAAYGFYAAASTWGLKMIDVIVENATDSCIYVANHDRPSFTRVSGFPTTTAGAGLNLTVCMYPTISEGGFTQSKFGLYITYTNAPTVSQGGWSVVYIYRCVGAVLQGLDLEATVTDDIAGALYINGESTYTGAVVDGGVISNNKVGGKAFISTGGITTTFRGTWFTGSSLAYDVYADTGSIVNLIGVQFTSGNVSGTVNFLDNTLKNGLVFYAPFDEGQGTSAYDFSGELNTGTITAATYSSGKYGSGLVFDGASTNVDFGTTCNPIAAITVAAWIKPNVVNDWAQKSVLCKYDTGVYQWLIGLTNTGAIRFDVYQNQTNSQQALGGSTTVGTWAFITGTYDGQTAKLYKDGVLLNAQTFATAATIQNVAPKLYVGYESVNTRYFNGTIDGASVYSRALNQAEIMALYSARNP